MKPRYKRRIFWSIISLLCTLCLSIVLVPPLINLNYLKPRIEFIIAQQTGLDTKINGSINFSLIGGATVVAHNITFANGTIEHVLFSVPMFKIFQLESAPLTGTIFMYGAQFNINKLNPPQIENTIIIKDSILTFKGKDYRIIQGSLSNGSLRGIVRSNQHKYEFDSNGDEFHIKNKNNNLYVSGKLYSDGSVNGTISIDTDNINKLFKFPEPLIDKRIQANMDFDWNGNYGFVFSNIRGNNFNGRIELFDDGRRDITLHSDNIDYDLSFLLGQTGIFYKTTFNLNLAGKLRFANKEFRNLKIDAIGTSSDILINTITADDLTISGGRISHTGAEHMPIHLTFDSLPTYCLFSGTPEKWQCSEFTYGDMSGSLSVENNTFNIFITSDKNMPEQEELIKKLEFLGANGEINFQFSDIGGTVRVNKKQSVTSYTFAKNKTLNWTGAELNFLPDSIRNTIGDFSWNATGLIFTPHSNRWQLLLDKKFFQLDGKNAKDWFPGLDLQSINDLEYTVSGNYKDKNISNLEIRIAGHVFKGTAIGNSITLSTKLLNIDSFANQKFIDNYDELQFFTSEPIMIPFSINTQISLSSDTLIYNGNDFSNFVYSLTSDTQSFSITDSRRGNLLGTISRAKNRYNIILQLNRFIISNRLLSATMPLNISNTMITGEISLSTYGQIAYDIWYNLSGELDILFDGGSIVGLGVDNFYASAKNATTLNSEFLLSTALDSGISDLKNLRIIGEYNNGNFITTTPFLLSLRHADANGFIQINDGKMSLQLNLLLRGTSPLPVPIFIEIASNGTRSYSLSQIMINFDPNFFRDFVATHNKF